jgi:hypothetical protein
VNNALGMLRVATKLGCDAIVSKCAQYLEAVPWEENEEEEILKTLPGIVLLFLCILLSPQGQQKYGLVAHTDVLHLAT